MEPNSYYSTRIQTSFDDDQADIFKVFRANQTAKEGPKVSLINYFKGLPITSSARILGIDKNNLDLDVEPLQAVAISMDRYTFIRSKLFPFPLAASVLYVNIRKHMVTLSKLCYIELHAEKCAAVRVDFDPTLPATLQFDDQTIEGALLDISLHGVALGIKELVPLESGTETLIKFMLPDLERLKQTPKNDHHLIKENLIMLPATLVAIAGDRSPYRYKFRITLGKHQEQLISRYSFHRQLEIIHGLKEMVV